MSTMDMWSILDKFVLSRSCLIVLLLEPCVYVRGDWSDGYLMSGTDWLAFNSVAQPCRCGFANKE
jgi:hypothetical protein